MASLTVSAVAFLLACPVSPAAAQATPSAVPSGQTYPIFVPKYAGLTSRQCDELTDAVERQQAAIQANVLTQLTQNNPSVEAKGELIRLVGELRIYGALDFLIKNIHFWHIRAFVDGVSTENETATATHMDGGFVAEDALVDLGRLSYDAILDVIGSRRENVPFNPANVDNYCRVLYNIKGSSFTTQQVQKLLAGTNDPKVQPIAGPYSTGCSIFLLISQMA